MHWRRAQFSRTSVSRWKCSAPISIPSRLEYSQDIGPARLPGSHSSGGRTVQDKEGKWAFNDSISKTRPRQLPPQSTKPERAASTASVYEQLFPEKRRSAGISNSWKKRAKELLDSDLQSPPPRRRTVRTNGVPRFKPTGSPLEAKSQRPFNKKDQSPAVPAKLTKADRDASILILSNASSSLLDTDFSRLAPKGLHVDGWVGGLRKVIQARDPVTYEPLGQYYLVFTSTAAAMAYKDGAERLHALARRRLSSSRKGFGPIAAALPSDSSSEDESNSSSSRAFTLVPPSVDLSLKLRPYSDALAQEVADKANAPDAVHNPRVGLAREGRVLLVLDGAVGLTVGSVRAAIEEDGRDRSLPWRLHRSGRTIVPMGLAVRARGAWRAVEVDEDLAGDGGGGETQPSDREKEEKRFVRFVVSFVEPDEAWRFVRSWHKRTISEVYDEDKRRNIIVDTLPL